MKKIYLIMLLVISSIQMLKAQIQYTEQPGSPCTPFNNGGADFADVDGDGDIDFIITGASASGRIAELYLNDGNAGFSLVTGTPFVGLDASSVEFGDVDGDNDQDVIISGAYGSTFYCQLFINDGLGNFTLSTLNSFQPNYDGDIQFVDVDNDNDLDVFIAGQGAGLNDYLKLYLNDGNGVFIEDINNVFSFSNIYGVSIAVADIDGDNDQDLLIAGVYYDTKLYLNDGNGIFTEVLGHGLEDVEDGSVDFADFDGDNDQDIILTGQGVGTTFHAKVYVNDGFGAFTLKTDLVGVKNSSVSVADADNDGDIDILIAGTDYNSFSAVSTYLYLNDGNANFTYILPTPFIEVGQVDNCYVKLFDADNDMDQDVFVAGLNTGIRNSKLYLLDCIDTYTNVVDSICRGGDYLFPDGSQFEIVADTTFLFDTLTSIGGCDSFLVKNLYVKPFINPGLIIDSVCLGTSYTFIDGNTITILNDTIYQSYIAGSLGCDSLVNTSIYVYPESLNAVLTANATLTETCDTTTVFSNGNLNSIVWSGGIQDGVSFTPPIGSTTYYVAGTTQNGCSFNDSIVISRAKPLDPFAVVNGETPLGGNPFQYLCGGQIVVLDPYGLSPNGSYDMSNTLWSYSGWSAGNPSNYNMYLGAGDSVINIMVHPYGCYDTLVVKMRHNPTITITTTAVDSVFSPIYAGDVPVICSGEAVTLTASGLNLTGTGPFWLNPTGYFWDNGVVNGQSFVPSVSGSYQVIARDDYQCEAVGSVYVGLYPSTTLTMDPFLKNPICLKDNPMLLPNATPTGGVFSGQGVLNNTNFNPNQSGGVGTHTIAYQYVDTNGCANTIDQDIDVIESPDFNYSTNNLSVTLSANNLCSNYYWDFGDGNTSGLTTNPAHTYADSGTYSVCLVCNDIATCINCINLTFPSNISGNVNGTVGVEEVIKSDQFTIYPNPNNGQFSLLYDDKVRGAEVSLYSISGQLLTSYTLSKTENSLQVDISNFKKGIYFVYIKTDEGVVVKRIVKN